MLRFFLKSKLQEGKKSQSKMTVFRHSPKRNRRLYERYNVSQHHLTVLNDQDILVIREISAKGFSSDVSDRAYQRFVVGDVYDSRLRYRGESHDFKIKLSWKRNKTVGFEIVDGTSESLQFISRLIYPFEIGTSMREINPDFLNKSEGPGNRIWLQGRHGTDVSIYSDDRGEVVGWRMTTEDSFIEWMPDRTYRTGLLAKGVSTDASQALSKSPQLEDDAKPDPKKWQFAVDVIMAMSPRYQELLLPTLEDLS